MLTAGRQVRLATVRELIKSAAALTAGLDGGPGDAAAIEAGTSGQGRGRGRKTRASKSATEAMTDEAAVAAPESADDVPDEAAAPKLAASDRRAAAGMLVEIWASVARDLAVASAGATKQLREMALVDELLALGPAVSTASIGAFLDRLGAVDRQLDENVNPELALDVLALCWPHVATSIAPAPAQNR